MVALAERTHLNGQELLAEFIQYGHQKPFEEIVRRYAGMVFNVCLRVTKDKHEAEDATQAVFLTLALQARRGTEIKALGPWLQQVAKRLALDNRRSKKRRKTREERHHEEQTYRRISLEEQAIPSADMDELKTILHEELQKLPAKYRLPLILHYFGGMSRDEMAAELNCKASTLGVRIFRGREMLAGRLNGRGIDLPPAMLALAMAWAVRQAISDALITSTSHAATAMMAGHSGAGYASANVIALTRRAGSALAIGKIKVTAATLLLAAASLGAGGKALGILPQINVPQILSDQLQRLIRPFVEPLTSPMRVDARTRPVPRTVAVVSRPADVPVVDIASLIPKSVARAITAKPATSAGEAQALAVNFSGGPTKFSAADAAVSVMRWTSAPSAAAAPADDHAAASTSSAKTTETPDTADVSTSSGSASGGGGFGGIASGHYSSDALPAKSNSIGSSSNATLTLADLYVGSVSSGTGSAAGSTSSIAHTTSELATPQIVQVAAIGGTVIATDGTLRGWGQIERTGVLQINGKVIADGHGVDRTLNLTSFSSVQTGPVTSTSTATTSSITAPVSATVSAGTSSTNATTPTSNAPTSGTNPPAPPLLSFIPSNGWYAVDHGRLSLGLQSLPGQPSMLTWGDEPSASTLSLVNSVRLNLDPTGKPAADGGNKSIPPELALLAPDRGDAPDLFEIDGATIGLWQVDPDNGEIAAADLTIRYDDALCTELGASQSSLQLWTLGSTALTWQPASSTSLDLADHLISGFGEDFSYFAVSVTPAPGRDVDEILAHPLAGIAGPASSQAVPEPASLSLLAVGTALLGRRRRRSASRQGVAHK